MEMCCFQRIFISRKECHLILGLICLASECLYIIADFFFLKICKNKHDKSSKNRTASVYDSIYRQTNGSYKKEI